MDSLSLEARALKLREDTTQFCELLQASNAPSQGVRGSYLQRIDPKITQILAPSICKLASILVPVCKQSEVVYANDNKDQQLCVFEDTHGPDLYDKNNNHYEYKTSTLGIESRSCNFNWPVPKGDTEAERRQKLLVNIREKVRCGSSILVVKDSLGRTFTEFRFSQNFLLGYFERIRLGIKGSGHNMGCKLCPGCSKFHRLEKLQYYNDLLMKRATLSEEEWKLALIYPSDNCAEIPGLLS